MPKIAIRFENISKQYRLGTIGTGTLSHDLNRWWQMNIRGKDDPYLKIGQTNTLTSRGGDEFVWALRDINLEVEQGEVLGIIGKNGAGKSTLLKLLSRVTSPSTGRILSKGRIASLLEVGTGFHPEMTGRENIFMNGAIMGMTKAEIRRKFDEIVDFAGVERYIDTPVKRYSSGMMVRLGFAVAAHLEPEILVVDEVLAVGDAEFQKKAIGKMQDVSRGEGRTVLFVSHNLGAVRNLCKTGVLLINGKIEIFSSIANTIDAYEKSIASLQLKNTDYYKSNLLLHLPVEIISVKLRQPQNETNIFDSCKKIDVEIEYIVRRKIIGSTIYIIVVGSIGDVFWSFDTDENIEFLNLRKPGDYFTKVAIPGYLLKPGDYSLRFGAGVVNSEAFEDIKNAISFKTDILSNNSSHLSYSSSRNGMVGQSLFWNTKSINKIE